MYSKYNYRVLKLLEHITATQSLTQYIGYCRISAAYEASGVPNQPYNLIIITDSYPDMDMGYFVNTLVAEVFLCICSTVP